MLKGAYSEKFKTIQQERLDKAKEERKDFIKARSDRAKELSKETNRRRKALEERKKEQQENEEKTREEVLVKRKQEQQEATQRFQKDTVQKKKQEDANTADKEPIPVRDGRYVVRGHVVEVKDGKQIPHAAPQPTQLAPQQQAGVETWRNEMPANYDFQNRYNEFSNGHTNSGISYAMNDFRNEGKLYSTQPAFDPYGTPLVPARHEGYGFDGKVGERTENGPVVDTLTMTEQEKLRADAIAKSGPKLAFIIDESQREAPEGALPCIMGRESPGGSVTSLDSLDELPGKGQESGAYSKAGIMAKGGRDATKSAGKRRVTFSDSIEFDDGVTGHLVTEEKQSTKVYTMLYARNVNNYYNMPSSSSASASGFSGGSQKGNKATGVTSVTQTRTEQNSSGMIYSSAKTFGKEPSVATVIHCDQPKAKPVAINNHHPTKPEKMQSSSRQENLSKEFSLRQEDLGKNTEELKDESDVVSDVELNDSLEVVRDSLDETDNHVDGAPLEDDEECKESSAVTWTIGASALKDSLERYVQSTAESTAEELIDAAPSSDDRVGDRDSGFVSTLDQEENERGSVSNPPGEIEHVYAKPGYMANTSPVTSGYQYYQPLNTGGASAVVTSPHFYHHNANVYSGLHSPALGTFHQNFPYPFYTSAGTTLMGMSPARQEQQKLENSPIAFASQFAATNYRVEGREVVHSIEPQRAPVQEAVASPSTGQIADREATNSTGLKEGGRRHVESNNDTNKAVTSRQKHSSSPSSTSSTTSSSTRSTRSLIPRPPAAKKTGRGRVHPGTFYRKQITARPRKGIHNHQSESESGQSLRNTKANTNSNRNSQTERAAVRQNSASPRTGSSRNGRTKRPNSGKHDSADHDGIIEGIKRNMEMMNMRARTTAAEEQHQRILNSLRLEFGDGKWETSSHQSPVYGGSRIEDNHVAENPATKQDTAGRRVHHPRVGSAGSRAGRTPAGGSVRVDQDSYQTAGSLGGRPPAGNSMRMNLANDDNYQPAGSRAAGRPSAGGSVRVDPANDDSYQPAGRPPAGNSMRMDLANDDNYQSMGPQAGRPPVGNNIRPDPASDGNYQAAAARGSRLPAGGSVRMEFATDGSYQPGYDGYPSQGRVAALKTVQTAHNDSVNGIVQKPPYAPGVNQQLFYVERRHEYPTSTVGHPTSAATTRQEREEPLQASGITLHERADSDLKRSISLDKTPTDDEINHLWAHVRSYLHGGNTKSVGSDSCVNRVDVRRSRTRSSSTQQAFTQRTAPQQNTRGSQLINGQLLGVPPQTGGSTLGGLRRYGSHEVLRRDSSSDSLSLKRSPLLQHRALKSRQPQKHVPGQNGRPPLPRQHQYNPSPSQTGPSASMSTRGGGPQPLSPAEMQAVMMASEKEMLHRHQQDKFAEMSPHQQYQAMMSGRAGPSALSLEEQRLLQSLDRLNERLKAQEEITKAITQKPTMNDTGARKAQQSGQGGARSRKAQSSPHNANRNLLHTR